MYWVRLRSWLMIPSLAALLAAGCGEGKTLSSPTAPSPLSSADGLLTDDTPDVAGMASSDGEFATLSSGSDRDRSGGGNSGKGGGSNSGSGSGSDSGKGGGRSDDDDDDDDNDRSGPGGGGNSGPGRGDNSGPGRGDRDSASEVRVEGVISDLSPRSPSSASACTFKVNGTTVTTNSSTRFDKVTCATLANDMTVEVGGTLQNGGILATRVKGEEVRQVNEVRVEGVIADFSPSSASACTFKVNGTTVMTNFSTRFDNVTCATLANGMTVEVRGMLQNGGILATRVKAELEEEEDEDEEDADVPTIRVRCETRANPLRSKVSVDGNDLAAGMYSARIASGTSSPVTSGAQATDDDEVEFDFDSAPDDIAAGATAIPANFIQGGRVTGAILDASGNMVLQAEALCMMR